MKRKKDAVRIPELLAPAGSYEGFEAALGAGADAVYVGGSAFGARAYARNFTDEELLRAIDMAHIHGRKLYLTVNTLVKNREMESALLTYLTPFVRQGLDAVLVQDMGVLRVLHAVFPELPLHASTQMAVTGAMSMRFLLRQGICRVVPARELCLRELLDMKRQCPEMEIETFVHGALCYCYSGMCLLSSLIGGRSGNRGRCAQPCRLPYQGVEPGWRDSQGGRRPKKGLISMKDLNAVDILPELVEAGIASLKIEGRMKQPSYASGVVSIYRRYLDLIRDKGTEDYQVEEEDRQALGKLFSRGGSCTGYYHQHNSPEMIFYENSEKKDPGAAISLPVPRRGVNGRLSLHSGSPMTFRFALSEQPETEIVVEGDPVLTAVNRPASEADVRRQMERLGETPFCFEKLTIDMDDTLFLPVKSLNSLRRKTVEVMEARLTAPYRRKIKDEPVLPPLFMDDSCKADLPGLLYVSCENGRIASLALANPGVAGVYVPMETAENILIDSAAKQNKEIYLSLPYLVRDKLPEDIHGRMENLVKHGLAGFLVHNLEGFALISSLGWADRAVLDHSLYAWNDQAVSFWREQNVLRITAPIELNEGELRHRNNQLGEMVIYGYLPAMVTAQCVRQTIRYVHKERPWCDKGNQTAGLIDRYGNTFKSQCVCRPWKTAAAKEEIPCYNMIYNSLPLNLLGQIDRLKTLHMKSWRLVFTLETEEEASAVLEAFTGAMQGSAKEEKAAAGRYTKGHFHRGVE